jgi:DNA repair photolyase
MIVQLNRAGTASNATSSASVGHYHQETGNRDVRRVSRQPIIQPCSLEGHAYQIDPYIGCEHLCRYCYALNQAETDWTQEILTYQGIVAQLGRELAGLGPQSIYMGWSTDPYQPAERVQRQTRRVLEVLASRGHSVCILTKSGLVARDVDLLPMMPGSSAGVSLAFQDEQVRQLFEAKAPPNEQRIDALKALKMAGVRTYALICPVMPFITDVGCLVEMAAAWADTIWVYALSMEAEEDPNWRNVQGILDRHFPQMGEPYRQIAFSADHPYWLKLRHALEEFQARSGLDLRVKL